MRKRKKILGAWGWAVGLGVVVGVVVGFWIFDHQKSGLDQREIPFPSPPPPSTSVPFRVPDGVPGKALDENVQPIRAKVAIVIDDMGYDIHSFHALIGLGVPMTFAILPSIRYSVPIAKEAVQRDYEVMLHLPMQPEDPAQDPGPGAIAKGMSLDEIRLQTRRDLEEIPQAVGVNNHMGSLMTQDPEVMAVVLEEIRKENRYFLDSKTTPRSVAYQTAKSLGVRAAQRQVFLDDVESVHEIHKQVDILEQIAIHRGEAIAIGHPRPHTVSVLKERLPEMRKKGIELVFLSELVK